MSASYVPAGASSMKNEERAAAGRGAIRIHDPIEILIAIVNGLSALQGDGLATAKAERRRSGTVGDRRLLRLGKGNRELDLGE